MRKSRASDENRPWNIKGTSTKSQAAQAFCIGRTVYEEIVARFGESDAVDLQEQVSRALVRYGTLLFWDMGREQDGVATLLQATRANPDGLFATANLLWMYIATGELAKANAISPELDVLTDGGRSLMLAGLELAADNLGTSLAQLSTALDQGMSGRFDYSEDLLWYLRIAEKRGYGERLIQWFSESGNSDRYAPVYGAFVAHVRGERFLLDLNPEVRGVAQPFFAKLTAGRKHKKAKAGKKTGKKKG